MTRLHLLLAIQRACAGGYPHLAAALVVLLFRDYPETK
jgi:hypothetical protein